MSKNENKEVAKTKRYQILIDWSPDYPILTERDLRDLFEGTGIELNYDSLKFYRNQPFQYLVHAKATEETKKEPANKFAASNLLRLRLER